ncbi:TolC family protein [Dysgonomonas sp. GY75]|uniref:TolC family protein n=1 Tax=Dysgonomonas sp. GY75 TaxID=2780419 RepID=UPI0018841A04|nr:TolC family protein [Dysgonomonas sp. GY75]
MNTNKIYTTILVFFFLMNFVSHTRAQDSEGKATINLSFQEYLNQVGKNNLNYMAEKYNVNIADAEVIAQKVLPDPELTFEGADENFSLGLGYTLELGNKRGARIRLAKSQAELEKLALEYYYQELRAEAADLYLDAMQQRELLDVKKSSYEYMLQLSKSDSIRFRLGEITEIDARQSKLEAATLLNEVFEQEAAYKSALATLNQYMGQTTLSLMNLSGKWSNIDRDYLLPELIATGLASRIDLYAAKKNIDIAANRQKLVKAERRMDLGLSVSYERDWHGFFPPSRSVTAGVSIPLQFSNLNKGTLKVADYGIEQTKVQKQNIELQIQTEISQAFFQFEASQKKSEQYQTGLLEDAKKVLDGMVYKYKRGESNITDVLIAQRTYNEVQELYLETMKGYASSLVALQKACGIWDIDF